MRGIWVIFLIQSLKASKPNTNRYKLSWLSKEIIEDNKWVQKYAVYRTSKIYKLAEFRILGIANSNLAVLCTLFMLENRSPRQHLETTAATQCLCGM